MTIWWLRFCPLKTISSVADPYSLDQDPAPDADLGFILYQIPVFDGPKLKTTVREKFTKNIKL
jgi:hypothetical protein